MSTTKQLLLSIVEGKDYHEVFKSILSSKIEELVQGHRKYIASHITERELTDAEMKKREEIVKSMKKKRGDFEQKYGERAKDVMYATATKLAKNEQVELDEEADLTKIPSAQLRQTAKLHRLRGTPESIKAAERGEAELKRRQQTNEELKVEFISDLLEELGISVELYEEERMTQKLADQIFAHYHETVKAKEEAAKLKKAHTEAHDKIKEVIVHHLNGDMQKRDKALSDYKDIVNKHNLQCESMESPESLIEAFEGGRKPLTGHTARFGEFVKPKQFTSADKKFNYGKPKEDAEKKQKSQGAMK